MRFFKTKIINQPLKLDKKKSLNINVLYDRIFFWLLLGLISIGFVIISSGSIPTGLRLANDPCYFIKRVIIYYSVTFLLSVLVLRTPIIFWKKYSVIMLICSYIMLTAALILNNSTNGASRWIMWGSLCIQPAELSKLSFICYLSNYLERKSKEVRAKFWSILKPIIIMIILAVLLLAQPDFGSIIILFITTLAILFLFGAKLCQLIWVFILNIFLIVPLIVIKPYRIQRIFTFWDPWRDPFGNGYQLTQSLIAFGRGKCFGEGLGNSVLKLEYLPEAHTDFIFSILSEELGYFGAILVLFMLFVIVFRGMIIGYCALNINHRFSGILACSISIWFGLQIFINIGTVSGILPTKGLTLPFISYGGSSFLITVMASMQLLRIDFETRLSKNQAFLKRIKK
ncbi:cell division protein FtsW [Blochmannia endosymbiont of Camponotus sp. C-003]|uniref:cell division protein FtsW n=1 Tax=unclassified Candidatus Blochmanniella TaxID=711328 RepID=UPI0020244595|nr:MULTISPECIES: cell division protein FtsW [unclassified Candidatus Blochmannia]URJ23102.1 cell division protein FtsW [Blochmannia endosymbiont of Camponotus sp. C-003]URJ28569.1 cell division protein FtsW [Blochmannia endosymbiont of Camponotus sp. C-046]